MRDRFSSLRFLWLLVQVFLAIGWVVEGTGASASFPARRTTQVESSVSGFEPLQAIPPRLAQNQPSPELKQLLSGTVPPNVITSRTPSPYYMTIPSLWWVAEQIVSFEKYGPKLLQGWIAYPTQSAEAGQVDLLVNRQLWSLLDYLQRYDLVSRFSAIARSYGYNTRVYDNPDRPPVASYTCRFTPEDIRLLQESIGRPSIGSSSEMDGSRAEVIKQLTCNLDLDPVNRPGRFIPATGN